MKIVTFNIRCDYGGDGANNFQFRKKHIIDKINSQKPDVIGFQEVVPSQLRFLSENLPEYNIVGCGRDADFSGEHMVIACRKATINVLSVDTYWLSPTPNVPASRFDKQSTCPRTCTTALIATVQPYQLIRVHNTHLDHESDEARKLGFSVIIEHIKQESPLPFVLLGDFNTTVRDFNMEAFAKKHGVNITDVTCDIPVTFHDFGRDESEGKIDYIFASDALRCTTVARWEDVCDGVYLSDHYPLLAELQAK